MISDLYLILMDLILLLPNVKYDTAVLENNSYTKGALFSAQHVVGPLDPNTVSLSILYLYLRTVGDCPEDSVFNYFVLFNLQSYTSCLPI